MKFWLYMILAVVLLIFSFNAVGESRGYTIAAVLAVPAALLAVWRGTSE